MSRLFKSLSISLLLFALLPAGCGKDRGRDYNLILISLDTLRSDHLGCYGYQRAVSPNIDGLARRGVLFENAISASSWTLPSHISLFTSLYSSAHGVELIDLSLPASETTLAEILKEEGYATGGFTGGVFLDKKFGFGQGFDVYRDDLTRRLSKIMPPALDWLEQNAQKKFFLFLHCYDIHFPYYPEDRAYREKFAKTVNRVPFEKLPDIVEKWNREEALSTADLDDLVFIYYRYFEEVVEFSSAHPIRDREGLLKKVTHYIHHGWEVSPHFRKDLDMIIGLYDSEILATDHQLGQLLDFLSARQLWHNTLVVLVSDHGEGFLEHGLLGHTTNLYQELLSIPLIMVFPGEQYQASKVRQPVRLIDIMPTILDDLGIADPRGEKKRQGASLLPLLDGRDMDLPAYAATRNVASLTGLVWKNHKLIINEKNGAEELFDLSEDPLEKTNLISTRPGMRKKILKRLKNIQEDNDRISAAIPRSKVSFDEELQRQLQELGYIN